MKCITIAPSTNSKGAKTPFQKSFGIDITTQSENWGSHLALGSPESRDSRGWTTTKFVAIRLHGQERPEVKEGIMYDAVLSRVADPHGPKSFWVIRTQNKLDPNGQYLVRVVASQIKLHDGGSPLVEGLRKDGLRDALVVMNSGDWARVELILGKRNTKTSYVVADHNGVRVLNPSAFRAWKRVNQ